MTISCAQTSLQLFNQLQHCGYSVDEMALIRDAYNLGMGLFTGRFRPSGKPFLAHAVGTASLLGSLRAPATVAAAGLLHAAYSQGEFGTGWRGISKTKRQHVRRAIGLEAEELVARYTSLEWNRQTVPRIVEDLGERSAIDRHVVLIRLANELDDYLDLGVLYCANAEDRLRNLDSHLHLTIPMAERLGYPELASALDQVFNEARSGKVPASLRNDATASYTLGPLSHRPRRAVIVHRFVAGPFGSICRRLLGWRRGRWIEQTAEQALSRLVLAWDSLRFPALRRPFVGGQP